MTKVVSGRNRALLAQVVGVACAIGLIRALWAGDGAVIAEA